MKAATKDTRTTHSSIIKKYDGLTTKIIHPTDVKYYVNFFYCLILF